jgi:O-succinylbenzoate synthase
LPVRRPDVDLAALGELAAPPNRVEHWQRRMADVEAVRQDRRP